VVHYEFIDPGGEGMGAGKEDERGKASGPVTINWVKMQNSTFHPSLFYWQIKFGRK
jgi:hypothetical protein